MKLNFNKRDTLIAVYAFLVLAAAILFHGFLNNLTAVSGTVGTVLGLLKPFFYAFAIAYILNPVLKFFEHDCLDRIFGDRLRDKPKRGVSILLTYLFAIALIVAFFRVVMPQLILSITGLVSKLSRYLNTADTWLPGILALFPEFDFFTTLSDTLKSYTQTFMATLYSMLTQLVPWMVSFSTRFASGLLNIVVGVIISIYMLMDKERFFAGTKKIWYAMLPQRRADWLLDLTDDANRVFGGFISGKILDSLIIGIICFAGMSILGMPNPVLVSVIVGVTNVIPYFGPFIGAVPSFFIILIDNPIKSLWFLVFILILQQFDGNILGPKILGDSTGLSAFWVIFSIMLFGGLYGFLGMFLGVPVFSVIYMLVRRLVDSRLELRGLPVDDDSYAGSEQPLLRPTPGREEKKKDLERHPRSHFRPRQKQDPSGGEK